MFINETWERQTIKLFTSEEADKARNQKKADSDQKKAISMAQAFNLLILIFSIIDTG